ncbi:MULTISPECIES: SDR family NAD(P)-dependent oxidoreductase [Staphylococcus]|jgi:NAD(P)-dependent dehydrogenase (short-subunit alcohol dehydrogenase family)|uniref:SDR family NAD(P)-dependent oxidoreductase n=1 Tax=Staphylococcus TaxID=1279 RepID=UPI0010716407|nr:MULTISPECIES: SDR family oxidoreductase [Staphylococcus]MBF0770517.1 SDR family oxidoreductase [Staphylococcus warneri]MCF7595925.1 SDR family oxidoreductase [Staphylococcus warneri]TFU64243.1 SDR family oxidoreductase [Staphylococcus warneri]
MKKNVLITGGFKGIGKQISLEFLKNDYHVIATSRFVDSQDQSSSLFAPYDKNVTFYQLDITDEKQVKNTINKIIARFGKLDVLINNAGISLSNGLLSETETSDFNKMINTNILGTYYCMKYALQHMVECSHGSIVNIASITGLNGFPYSVLYGSTKHAIIGLTKGAAIEFADKDIKINAVAPGIIKTETLQKEINSGEFTEDSISSIHPMQKLGTTLDVAKGVYFLANENNSFITGHVLNIDGGYLSQ